MPSVTTVRIIEHNRGSAAVMPVQGKQQEADVVDSAVMKFALGANCGHLSRFAHVAPIQEWKT